ncbi:MAG: hypothetical protein MR877_10320 [Spirochaetia bacterium]|nr:hypothetical protein [Spirochaetia bacterium]
MFYFKDSENPNSETKTGSTGSFIKYVEKHSCYKAAEKLLMALAEKKLLQVEERPDNVISQRKSKEIVVSIFTQILMKKYPLVTYICTDIGKMMSQLLYDSLKEFRKHLPSRSIFNGRKKLMEYHDSLVNVFEQLYEDDVFDELEIEHRKT